MVNSGPHVWWSEAESLEQLHEAQISRYFGLTAEESGALLLDYTNAVRIGGEPWAIAGEPAVADSAVEAVRLCSPAPHESYLGNAARRPANAMEQELLAGLKPDQPVALRRMPSGESGAAGWIVAKGDCLNCHDAAAGQRLGALFFRLKEIADD